MVNILGAYLRDAGESGKSKHGFGRRGVIISQKLMQVWPMLQRRCTHE